MTYTDLSRASSLARLDEFCEKYQLDHREMLREVGLPEDLLEQPEILISYSLMAQLLENCARKTGYPLFSLEYGVFQGAAMLGELFYLIKNAETVGDSLRELMLYYHLHSRGGQVTAAIESGMVVLSYEPRLRDCVPTRQAVELAVGVGQALLKMLLGAKWQPAGVHFRSGPSCAPQAYQRILGLTPQFNSTTNGWVFDARLLEVPLSNSDPKLHTLMREHIEKMDELAASELPAYVQTLIRHFLPNGRVTVDFIANYMTLSSRSLQRYLTDEGTSFQTLLDETRQSMAERYLSESAISLTQLAAILGYSGLAAFSRAFQRWHGQSPRQWRKQHGITYPARVLPQHRRKPAWLK
ncbi:AraC family transcriptional regulator [Marinobacter zhejiangensis]|uniref:AraC-type DNA-binding protein n=1 Tax=Marinobacter zhejiangensis TaxID=488535 RepID=A0A1I4MBF9_9GAMM|nr:AraC family transcriptional regulator [Marinobacter zhejiangensis]SFM00540.1 AraC-type DNA-binding protein [Marinobacter zhejiangensis]